MFLGGDDGIRSRANCALRSFAALTVIDCHSPPLLLRILSNSQFPVSFLFLRTLLFSGGDDGIRTHDPLLAGQVLSQLSYTPKG